MNLVINNIITFGHGLYGVDIGTLGDGGQPAVFIIPNGAPGPVGEKIPLELQGPFELEKLPNDWTVLLFPTRERCKEVADALVGSKMEKWSRDQVSQKLIRCESRPSTEAMCDLISAIIQDEASYDPATNKWDTSKAATAIVSAFDGA